MSKVLLDENGPSGLRRLIERHDVDHVVRLGWDGVRNGELIEAAERAGYEVMVTADQNLRYQQNLAGRALALIVLDTTLSELRRSLALVQDAIDQAGRATCRQVVFRRTARDAER